MVHTTGYDFAINKDTLPLVTTRMNLDVMLSEVNQTKKTNLSDLIYKCNQNFIKKGQTQRNRAEWWGRGWEMSRCWSKVHIFIEKMSKFWGPNVHQGSLTTPWCTPDIS